ncbi:CBS domain-containing protein [Halococcus sp. AFM35]|uniref:CBS domain-containing protein n=1 Tax=Halococcus sp. AFM35 TaxID=3421653 RepID=UPI003EBF9E03
MKDTPVSDIMTAPVRTVDGETTVAVAARALTEQGIGSLVVGEERIEGIVTETDVVGSVAEGLDPTETAVSTLMSEPVVTIRPDDSVGTAGERMGKNTVKKLPVTEGGQPVGIVTTTDLAHFLPQQRVGMSVQPEPDVDKGEYE